MTAWNDSAKSYFEMINAGLPVIVTAAITGGYNFRNISTSTTTVVKAGAGKLHSISINSKGTIASSITIYDSTSASGTKVATIDSLTLSGLYTYDADCVNGITVVTTGVVSPDITVMYK